MPGDAMNKNIRNISAHGIDINNMWIELYA